MKSKLFYWIPNSLLLLLMMGSALYYFIDPTEVAAEFTNLGYPLYVMYFNAIAKLLGGLTILFVPIMWLKDFAYAGFLYIILLAFQAHFVENLGNQWPMLLFIVIWALAYWQHRQRI